MYDDKKYNDDLNKLIMNTVKELLVICENVDNEICSDTILMTTNIFNTILIDFVRKLLSVSLSAQFDAIEQIT